MVPLLMKTNYDLKNAFISATFIPQKKKRYGKYDSQTVKQIILKIILLKCSDNFLAGAGTTQ